MGLCFFGGGGGGWRGVSVDFQGLDGFRLICYLD